MNGSTPQKVLYIDCAPWTGGAQRTLQDLVTGVQARGPEVRLAAADATPHGLLEHCANAGIPVTPLATRHWRRSVFGAARYLVDRILAARQLAPLFREWQPDLIHVNTVRAGLLVPKYAAEAIPVILHDRDVQAPRAARVLACSRAARIVTVSRCVAACWDGICEPDRLRVVYNGVAPVREAAPPPPDSLPPGDEPLAILVGDPVLWKRHGLFLEALAELAGRGGPCRGLLVGRPRDAQSEALLAELCERVRTGPARGSVRFVTNAHSAIPFIGAADVLVSTSDREPFGRTIVEALALGKPVLATGGGPAEILAGCEAGEDVAPTPEAIADGLLRAFGKAGQPAVQAAARERAARFTPERMVEDTLAVYRETRP